MNVGRLTNTVYSHGITFVSREARDVQANGETALKR